MKIVCTGKCGGIPNWVLSFLFKHFYVDFYLVCGIMFRLLRRNDILLSNGKGKKNEERERELEREDVFCCKYHIIIIIINISV